jgi:hypothetical protein
MEKTELRPMPWPPVVKYLRDTVPKNMKPNVIYPYVKGPPYGMVVGYAPGMVGWSLCHPNDTFSKAKGRMICYERANIGVPDWRKRLVRQTLHHSMGKPVTEQLLRHLDWDVFRKTYPKMAHIIECIEWVQQKLEELSEKGGEKE